MPIGINVPYGTELHTRIIDAVRARWKRCRDESATRYTKWRKQEEIALAYLPERETDAKRRIERDQSGKPSYVTIEVPYSYAQLLAAHTYECSVFLGRAPVHQFQGRHAITAGAEQALEAIIDYQVQVGQFMAPYYIWLYDKRKYGAGIIGTYWDEEWSTVTKIIEQPRGWAGLLMPGKPKKVRQTVRVPSYKGNRLYNIRPYDFIFDTRQTLANFQKGEYAGRYTEVGWNYVQVRAADGDFQNVEVLRKTKPRNWWRDQGSSQLNRPNWQTTGSGDLEGGYFYDPSDPTRNLAVVELCEMSVELIPKDWGLGNSEYPEKWWFVIGNDSVVLEARPLGLDHNKHPFDVLENEIEGYALFKRSMLEQLKPLNDTLTWLFNTHFYNVRKVLNDQLIVDPSRLTLVDLEDPAAGRIVRVKPEGYGQDVRTMYQQMQVVDVTQNNLRDSEVIMQLMQRLGASDNVMGAINPGGRKTATEVRQSTGFSINKLKTESEYASAMGWSQHAQKLVQNTQQFYDGAEQFRIAGPLMQGAERLVQVTPELITGFFDFVPVDGTMPVDRYAQAALWKELLQGMAQMPSLMMQYDLGRIFEHVGQLAGVRDVGRFRLQVTPDQVLAAQMQAGNVVPIGGRGKTSGGGAAGGAPGRLPGAPEVSGVGPVG